MFFRFSHIGFVCRRLTFPSVLRAIKECNQQLWKSWNACVECLQDRNSCSSVSGGNSRIVLRETFAENLLSALRLFMDNDLEVSIQLLMLQALLRDQVTCHLKKKTIGSMRHLTENQLKQNKLKSIQDKLF